MSSIHTSRQGFITKSTLPSISRQRGGSQLTPELMLSGAGDTGILNTGTYTDLLPEGSSITETGNPTRTNFHPFRGTGSSLEFDGTNDYLQVPYFSDLSLGTTYTIEMWIYPRAFPGAGVFITLFNISNATTTNFGYLSLDLGPGYIGFGTRASTGAATVSLGSAATTSINLNSWNHIALAVNSNSATLYINGAASGTATLTALNGTQTFCSIGYWNNGYTTSTAYYNGYISNLRVVKGTAVYTTAFTPKLEELTEITNTIFFLRPNTDAIPGNRQTILDASSNAHTITTSGDARQSKLSPFNQVPNTWSTYFDGTGDYLNITTGSSAFTMGTGDFTIECWIYPTSSTGVQGILACADSGSAGDLTLFYNLANATGKVSLNAYGGTQANSTASISINTWTHIAFSRTSGSLKIFINGVLDNTVAFTGNFTKTAFVIGRSYANLNQEHFVGYISNVRVIKGTGIYSATFNVPTQPLTAISGTSILTCQDNLINDNSVVPPTGLTRNGNVLPTQFNPLNCTYTTDLTRGSIYFDGTGDYVSVANGNNTPFDLGTGNFTVEFWFHKVSGTSAGLWDTRTQITQATPLIYLDTGGIRYYVSGTNQITGSTIQNNQWYHVALSRQTGTTRLFLNGILQGTYSDTNTYTITPNQIRIGNTFNAAQQLHGYISNFRVVKGTAVYTSNFEVPTQPLSEITNTSVLLLPNQYDNPQEVIDSSQFNNSITTVGQATHSLIHPFSAQTTSGSIYFDGTGDYLSTSASSSAFEFGTGAFTIECWIYFPTALPNNTFQCIFSYGETDNDPRYVLYYDSRTAQSSPGLRFTAISGGSAYIDVTGGGLSGWAANTWYHVAVTRDGNTFKLFRNGVQTGNTVTDVDSIVTSASCKAFVGSEPAAPLAVFSGYISNLRVIKGTALYTTTFTAPTQPLTNTANTTLLLNCTNTSSFQNTATNKQPVIGMGGTGENTQTFVLNTNTDYEASYYFDGTGDYLTVPYNTSLQFPADFTIECWFYPISRLVSYPTIISNYSTYATNQLIGLFAGPATNTTKYSVHVNGSEVLVSTSIIVYGAWAHVAITRSGSTMRLFVNGILEASTTNSVTITGTSNNWWIAAAGDNPGGTNINGYISNIRVIKGTAQYTSNFTPPTQPLQPVTNTSLLLATNNARGIDTVFLDTSPYKFAVQRTGDVVQTGFSPFQDTSTGSAYFDGNGDYLISGTASTQFDFGTGDFTIETWVYPIATGTAASETYLPICGSDSSFSPSSTNWTFLYAVTGGNRLVYSTYENGVGYFVNSNTYTPTFNVWQHWACVRSGGVITFYVNGVSIGGGSFTRNQSYNNKLVVGLMYGGITPKAVVWYSTMYLSNLRIVKGTAVYTSNFTPSTTPLTAITNTSLLLNTNNFGSLPQDTSSNRFPVYRFGDTRVVAHSPFASNPESGSYYFDGTGDYLSITRNSAFLPVANEDFTFEAWVYLTATPGATDAQIAGFGEYGTDADWVFGINSSRQLSLYLYSANTSYINTTQTITLNSWTHVAVSRSGTSSNNLKVFLNGVGQSFSANNTTVGAGNRNLTIGADQNGDESLFTGYISNFRIIKGTAVYTSNFTPPAEPLTAITNTSLLLTAKNWTLEDSSTRRHLLQRYGTPKLTTSTAPQGMTTSIVFDGIDDYIGLPSTMTSIGTQTFTLDFWIRCSTQATTTRLLGNATTWTTGTWTLGLNNGSGKLFLEAYNYNTTTPILTSLTSIGSDTWTHVAIVRNTNTWTLYIGGQQEAQQTSSVSLDSNIALKYIGWSGQSAHTDFSGYISNMRLVIGTAVYTQPFPPVAPANNTGFVANSTYGVYQLI